VLPGYYSRHFALFFVFIHSSSVRTTALICQLRTLSNFATPLLHFGSQIVYQTALLTYRDYTVGWICAIKNEETSRKTMLNDIHELIQSRRRNAARCTGQVPVSTLRIVFVVNREIVQSQIVASGRLVVGTRAPWEKYWPAMVIPDKNIGIPLEPRAKEILETTRGMPVHERFLRMVSRVLEDEDVQLRIL